MGKVLSPLGKPRKIEVKTLYETKAKCWVGFGVDKKAPKG